VSITEQMTPNTSLDPWIIPFSERSDTVGRVLRAFYANKRKIRLRLGVAHVLARLLPYDMFNHRRAAIYRASVEEHRSSAH